MRNLTPVTVTTTHGDVYLPWATSASVTRKGELRIYDGLRYRAYYAPGEWTQYTVQSPIQPAASATEVAIRGASLI